MGEMKAPAFQFYVADYMRDTRALTLAARGAWVDLLCQMWVAPVRGQITLSIPAFARLWSCSESEAEAVLDELSETGVALRSPLRVTDRNEKITVSNRRMLRENNERNGNAERQAKYREKQRKEEPDEGNASQANNGLIDDESNAKVTPPSSSSSSSTNTRESIFIDPETVVERWNEHSILPRIVKLTDKRKKQLQARCRDTFFAENFTMALDRITESKFCRGNNDRGWKANFDWFIQPDTVTKAIEGQYDNRANGKAKF